MGVIRPIALVLLSAALTACATTGADVRVERWDKVERPPTPDQRPIPILNREAISRPFQAIGMAQATVAHWQEGPTDDLLRDLLADGARKLGGDALVDLRKRPTGRADFVPTGHSAPSRALDNTTWTAVVIVWTGPAARDQK